MEQQTGAGGWDFIMQQPAPKPGQMRLWTFQSIAHGADFVNYFRWRTAPVGTEIYWHGLNDYSNRPNRRLEELAKIRDDVAKLADVAGSVYQAKIAYLKDYSNEWDGEQDHWHGDLDRFSQRNWFSAAQKTHTPMDLVYLNIPSRETTADGLDRYELLIYPHATILTDKTARLLRGYVERGGKLIMGARTGYKDEFGRCPMREMPGFASELCGARVTEFTYLGPNDAPESIVWDGAELESPVFNDVLEPAGGGQIQGTFKGNYYDGKPGLVVNQLGKGTAHYWGAGFSEKAAEAFLQKLGAASPYAPVLRLPEETELAVRARNGRAYFFILNYKPYEVKITVKQAMSDVLTGRGAVGERNVEPYGVLVLRAESVLESATRESIIENFNN